MLFRSANRVMANGWSAVTYPEILAQRQSERPRIPWPEVTALRAIRAELLSHLCDSVTPIALDLVHDYVPLPQEEPEGALSTDEPAHHRAFRYLTRTVFQPRRASRAIMRRSRKILAASGLWPGLRDKGVAS